MIAGGIAEKYLKLACGVEIVAFVNAVGKMGMESPSCPSFLSKVSRSDVDKSIIRCPDLKLA